MRNPLLREMQNWQRTKKTTLNTISADWHCLQYAIYQSEFERNVTHSINFRSGK